jgi:hypothetical protein
VTRSQKILQTHKPICSISILLSTAQLGFSSQVSLQNLRDTVISLSPSPQGIRLARTSSKPWWLTVQYQAYFPLRFYVELGCMLSPHISTTLTSQTSTQTNAITMTEPLHLSLPLYHHLRQHLTNTPPHLILFRRCTSTATEQIHPHLRFVQCTSLALPPTLLDLVTWGATACSHLQLRLIWDLSSFSSNRVARAWISINWYLCREVSKLFVTNGHQQIRSYLLVFCWGEAEGGSLENLLSAECCVLGGRQLEVPWEEGLWGRGKLTNICEFILSPIVIIQLNVN